MRRVKFIEDWDGFAKGEEADVENGIADCYVEWVKTAVYDEPKVAGDPEVLPAEKSVTAPPAHRMMEAGKVRKK